MSRSGRDEPLSGASSSGSSLPSLPGCVDTSSTGGYDYEFFPALDERFVCPICMLAMRRSVQTTCGHRFCDTCVRQWLRHIILFYSVTVYLHQGRAQELTDPGNLRPLPFFQIFPIPRFSVISHCQNQENICNNTVSRNPVMALHHLVKCQCQRTKCAIFGPPCCLHRPGNEHQRPIGKRRKR